MAGVTVAGDVLGAQGPAYNHRETGVLAGWETDPRFLVSAADGDHRALLPAIWDAGERFYKVDEDGSELAGWELGSAEYTPNFVFDPAVHPSGIVVHADTKNSLSGPMGATMVRILVEELTARRLSAHIAAAADGSGLSNGERAPSPYNAPEAMTQERERLAALPSSWYVGRGVWLTAANGRDYRDVQYWHADGVFRRDRSAAQRWPDSAGAVEVVTHVNENGGRVDRTGYGGPMAMRLPDDLTNEPWALPPAELRAPDPDGDY